MTETGAMIVEITAVVTMAEMTATVGVDVIRKERIRTETEMIAGVEAAVATTEEVAKIMVGIEVAATRMIGERTEATTTRMAEVEISGPENLTAWVTTLSTAGSARSYRSTNRDSIMRNIRDRAGVISVRQALALALSKATTVTLAEEAAVADSAEAEVEAVVEVSSIAVVVLAQPPVGAKKSSSPRTPTRFRSPRIFTSSPWQKT